MNDRLSTSKDLPKTTQRLDTRSRSRPDSHEALLPRHPFRMLLSHAVSTADYLRSSLKLPLVVNIFLDN